MNKKAFLSALRKRLSGLPQEDVQKSLDYYEEMINDRVEDGLSEAEAVEALGDIDEIINNILGDIKLKKLVRAKLPKRSLRGWEITLLILGAPLWFPLLVAGAAILFALLVVIFSLSFAVYATSFATAAASVACVAKAAYLLISGDSAQAVFTLGGFLITTGISMLMFRLGRSTDKLTIGFCKKTFTGVKRLFIRKESAI